MAHVSVALTCLVRPLPACAATCSLAPGKEGSPGTLSGIYDTYYQPPAGTLAAGTKTAGTSGVTQSISASQIPGVASGAECYSGAGGGTILTRTGRRLQRDRELRRLGPAANNNDFTARVFVPTGAPASAFANTDTTTPMVFTGAALPYGPTAINVPSEFEYSSILGATITLNATAPASPAGWTVRLCADNAGVPNCAAGAPWTIGGAGATATSTYAWAIFTTATIKYWPCTARR